MSDEHKDFLTEVAWVCGVTAFVLAAVVLFMCMTGCGGQAQSVECPVCMVKEQRIMTLETTIKIMEARIQLLQYANAECMDIIRAARMEVDGAK